LHECDAKKAGFAKGLFDSVNAFIEKLSAFLKNLSHLYDSGSAEAKAFRASEEKMKKLSELWESAFMEASGNFGVVYSSESIVPGEDGVTVSKDRATSGKINYADRELSPEFIEETINSFGITKLEDYIHVQRQVFNTLLNEGFFTNVEKRNRTDVNEESGMVIETNKSSIDETFCKNNYQWLGRFKK